LPSLLILIAIALLSAWLGNFARHKQTLSASGLPLKVQDGDSFEIGSKRLRLDGIDAPEYRQTCTDINGSSWACGKAARANLEKLLHGPGLVCEHEVADRYGRALASCRSAAVANIAAKQVLDGMAISHEYYGIRDYGDEEDAAHKAKRGIWRGEFTRPEIWRGLNPRQMHRLDFGAIQK
jgi:endonuclease YncB( thermonuclease family)